MNKWIYGYAASVVAIGGVTVAQNIWCLSKADWASWAQAIGTVAAVAGTIWLATRDDRRRASDAMAVARLTAAGMTYRVAVATSQVKEALVWIESASKFDCSPNDFGKWGEIIASLHVCSQAEELAVVPLPNRCAFALAGAKDRLHVAATLLKDFSAPTDRIVSEKRKGFAPQVSMLLNEAYRLLDKAKTECQLASHGVTSPYA